MISVDVAELSRRADTLLELVQRGETIEITDRGRPVALLSPIPDERGGLDRLRADGDVEEATASLDTLPPPLSLPPGAYSASDALADLRRDER